MSTVTKGDLATLLIYQAIPKEEKQAICKQSLAHAEPKRTFYWLVLDPSGPICQDCVNVRNTRRLLVVGSGDAIHRPEAMPRPGRFRAVEWSVVPASLFPGIGAFWIVGNSRSRK